jgi:hypothetical protein
VDARGSGDAALDDGLQEIGKQREPDSDEFAKRNHHAGPDGSRTSCVTTAAEWRESAKCHEQRGSTKCSKCANGCASASAGATAAICDSGGEIDPSDTGD